MNDRLPGEIRAEIFDSHKRPKDIEFGTKMRLPLPVDVFAEPTQEQLTILISRISQESDELFKKSPNIRRTDSTPIPREYGNTALLVAIDRDSLDKFGSIDKQDSYRMSPVEVMLDSFPISSIPPIFLKAFVYHGEKGKKIGLRDGAHRTSGVRKNEKIPYLLAYIRKHDKELVTSQGIVFREVEAVHI